MMDTTNNDSDVLGLITLSVKLDLTAQEQTLFEYLTQQLFPYTPCWREAKRYKEDLLILHFPALKMLLASPKRRPDLYDLFVRDCLRLTAEGLHEYAAAHYKRVVDQLLAKAMSPSR